MTTTIEVRPLRKADDRSGFCCGQRELDRFFQDYAGQNQFKLHLSVTYVVAAKDRLLGFATVAASSLERRSLPSAQLRRRLPGYPLPVLRLARLGVDTRAQGAGVGRALLRHVPGLALAQRDRLGCVGVVTDANPDAVAFFERYGLVSRPRVRQGRPHGGSRPMFRAIAAASSGKSWRMA